MSGSEEAALLRWAHETGVDLDQLTHPGITVKELEGTEREKLVRVFVRHLLLALNRLHEQGVAHLDLRPESILLNDNRLKLADFGQSRRLDHGFITGSIKGSPEFVSPEVVMGRPLTLATDIWSVGTLTCILLTGVSPFHGDNDNETLRNVSKGLFRTDTEEWDDFTDDAKDFVYALLQMDPRRRPNCAQALSLPWLRDEEVSMAPLSADCLREFKYKHKWLERRVFVQQSPSEQLLELLKHPPTNVAERGHPPAEGEPIGAPRPIDIYDYWRQQRGHPGHPGPQVQQGQQGHPQHPGHQGHPGHPGQPQHPSHYHPSDPRGHPQGPPHRHPQRFDENGNPLEERGRGQSPHHPPYQVDHLGRPIDPYGLPINYRPDAPQDQWGRQRHDRHPPPPSPGQAPIPVDQYGRFVHPEELARIQQQQGYGRQQQKPQDIPLDQYGRPIVDPRRQPVDQYGRPIPPELLRRLQQRPEDLTRPPPPYHPHHSPMGERRRLEPQEKGEAPSTERFPTPEQPLRRPEDNPLAQVPIRMIRGEHREIEEEIANRILSDISEEGSLAGSVASIDELEPYYSVRDYREQRRRARYSPDSTPQLEDNSSDEDSSPTLSPKTVKESETFFAASPTSGLVSPPEAVSPAPERVEEPEREQRKEEQLEKQKEEEKEAAKEITPPIDVRRPEFTPEKATSSPETVRYISDREESPISPKKFAEEEKKPIDQNIFDLKPKPVDEISPSGNKENMEKRKEDMKDVEDLDKFQTEILKEADANPNIPVGAPLFLEALERHHPFLISQSLTVDIPKDGTLSPVSPKTPRTRPRAKSAGGTGMKSPVVMSPGKEHSMEVLIATKRGKPEFIPPGEEVPELDDPEARSRDRQKKIQPGVHGPEDDFQDKQDELEKIKRTIKERKAMIDDLDKYRPKNFYKEEEANGGPDYDIDDSPWDSHYQIGPDTYLMASRGASFNSRVRDYRRELWGQGAPLVNQGYLGYRNRDITVRERRRYTDILREQQMQLEPKSSEHGTTLGKDPKNNAISRIKADIDKVAPAATKKNQDGTFAPIFAGRLRDVYLNAGSPSAVFECNVISSPAANVSWTKHGKELCEDGRHKFSQENGIARLTILQPSVYDLGEYVCTAANEYGQDKTACRMISGEAPNRPGRPNMELSSDTELFMTFEPPEGPTYLEGITYKLEYRMAGENDYGAPWVVVSANVDDEAIVIKHLEPLGTYQFRVTAKNGFGWGEPSLNSRIVRTHPRGSPKLQLEELSRTCRYNTVAMPQSKHRRHHFDPILKPAAQKSLEGISEESEDMEEEEEESGKKQTEVQLESGDFSGRFQLESVLFCTKYSVLRNAVDKQNETSCVAKIRHCPSDSSSKQEYETLQKGQHENVQTLLAAHLQSDFLHLFCERLYEDVFARFCFNDSYTEEQISMVSRQMAAALHWLHFRGIVHGDVNPHNVMFASKRSWIVKICDFSSAQFVGPEAKAPSDPDVQWAPPEYHTEGMPVTVQADIWGMGVVVFCLLGGFHPFTSEFDSPDEVKENVLNVKCDPNLIPVQASQEALSYVTWALKKSPIRRMRTDEALTHRFLSADPSAVRRREAIKYYSSRLRKTAQLTKQCFETPQSSELASKYGNAQ